MSPRLHPRPPLALSRLRDIGWTLWDPVGLLPMGGSWQRHPAADEYDPYLLAVAAMLRDGAPEEDGVAFLMEAELVGMGYGEATLTGPRAERARSAARRTVAAILAYLDELDATHPAPLRTPPHPGSHRSRA